MTLPSNFDFTDPYYERLAEIESGKNPAAKNPNSTAKGLFQFIDSTAKEYGVKNPLDPMQALEGVKRFTAANRGVLVAELGREPTQGELYLAHQQGPGGAVKLLSNPDAKAVDVVGKKQVKLNGGDENMTAGEFANKWISKFEDVDEYIDVELPDGTIVEGVPSNISQAELMQKVRASGIELGGADLPLDTTQAGIEAGTRGVTLGASDYVMPALGALYAKAFGGDATSNMSLEDLYNEAQSAITGRRQEFREQNPLAAYGAEIAGSLPTGGALLKGATGAATAAGLTGGKATAAGLSATGAIEGFGLSEDKTLADAALGAVLAPTTAKVFEKAGPLLVRKVRQFSETAAQPVKTTLGSIFKANPVAARQFMEEGIPVSALAVTDNPTLLRVGNTLRGTLGSGGVIENNIKNTLNTLEEKVMKKAFSTGGPVSPQEAGLKIQAGIENYVQSFKNNSSKLYAKADKFMGKNVSMLNNSSELINGIGSEFANDPKLSAAMGNHPALNILRNALDDANPKGTTIDTVTMVRKPIYEKGLRYASLLNYRTQIGNLLTDDIINNRKDAITKRVYAALSNDMNELAKKAGPRAYRAFNTANAYYSNRVEMIGKQLSRYVGTNADPGTLINYIKNANKNSDYKLSMIMRAIPANDKVVIRDAILQRMGNNTAGEFNVTTFFKNYSSMSKEAKKALFGNDQAFKQSLDRLYSISRRITEANKFYNFSESGNALGNIALIGLGVVNPTTAIATAGGSNLGARLLTNQAFVKTLAKYSSKPITQNNFTKFLRSLENLAADNPAMVNDISTYIGLIGASSATLMGEEE